MFENGTRSKLIVPFTATLAGRGAVTVVITTDVVPRAPSVSVTVSVAVKAPLPL